MRILVLTFYYPPDLSAGSFRAGAFVEALERRTTAVDSIDVITTFPNRYRSFAQEAAALERQRSVTIHRISLPPHTSGILDQSLAFLRFAREVANHCKARSYDVVFATSSRLLTAALGAYCARRIGASLYLDVRDVFTATIADLLRGRGGRLVSWLFGWLERYAIGAARDVNLVSSGFLEHFQRRYPGRRFSLIPNGVDELFTNGVSFAKDREPKARIRVLYAGNVGEAQGLHELLPALAARSGSEYEFIVVGDGGARRQLEDRLVERQIRNVSILPPVPRCELPALYADADVLLLHLNAWPALEHVIPSKLFEYLATGKPILAGIVGVAESFLRGEAAGPNIAIFPPCDVTAALRALSNLSCVTTDRSDFVKRYSREKLMDELVDRVLLLG